MAASDDQTAPKGNYLYEPDARLLLTLLVRYVQSQVYEPWSKTAAEQAAR